MSKWINYLGLLMAVVYFSMGLYLLFGEYVFDRVIAVAYGNILGGILIAYGIFRTYRFLKHSKNEQV